jgi:nucleoside phosphorylase
MLNILIVEDDTAKLGKIHLALIQYGVDAEHIVHTLTLSEAAEQLRCRRFDLMLLDINIPRRLGEKAMRGGGLMLLAQLKRDNGMIPPGQVVGITAYDDVIEEFGEEFANELWSLILFREDSDQWKHQIEAKLAYLNAFKSSLSFSDGVTYGTDLAIVCALADPELKAVQCLPCDWQPLRMRHDETRYITGTIQAEERVFSIVAAAAPRMGMPASAVLASKMIAQFRPRFVAMVGICAGRSGKVNLGDVIVADPSWDWGSGKILSVDRTPHFQPSPHQLELDVDVTEKLKETLEDVQLLARIKAAARGNKPNSELRVHFKPMASGAAVVANRETFAKLIEQHRELSAIEMEGYGVATACKGSGKPRPLHVIMKSVCDYADEEKNDDFREYAAHTSALAMYHAVMKLLPK